MSRINDLITELAPSNIEFHKIGDVAQVGTGSSDRKESSESGEYPFYVRSRDVLRIDSYEFDEEAIVIPGEGGIGEIFHYVSGKYALHQRAYRIRFQSSDVDTKFAYYYFSTHFKQFILLKAVNATVSSIRKPMIADFRIPVPPLDVQHEIVRILDRFTELEAELEAGLEAELDARQHQYHHYRDSLFAFTATEAVQWTTMGNVGTFTRGRRFTKSDVAAEGIGSIHYGEIYTRYGTWATKTVSRVRSELAPGLRFARPGDVVIAAVGETVDDVCKAVAWLGDEDVAVHDDCFIFRHSMNPKFVSYYLQTDAFRGEKAKHVARAKVKRVSGESLARLTIPVPPLDEQERIVATLDRFDALVNDLSIVLPAELKARRQQYEHYRDRLLTFPEAA